MESSIQSLVMLVSQLKSEGEAQKLEIKTLKDELTAEKTKNAGYTAGQNYGGYSNRYGGPANILCLPRDPELSNVTVQNHDSFLYGTEFETTTQRHDAPNEDVPCAVCKNNNAHSSIMIPGRNTCYSEWNVEYNGLLASDSYGSSASSYICIDNYPEYVSGGQDNKDGRLLYFTRMKCGSLSCPPYKDNLAVNCVVCSQ